jgi:hypothetical protein
MSGSKLARSRRPPTSAEAELRAERHDVVSSTHGRPVSPNTMTRSSSGDKMAVRDVSRI